MTNKVPETEAEERLAYYEWKKQQAEKEKAKKEREGIKAFLMSYKALRDIGFSEDSAINVLAAITYSFKGDSK